MTCFKTFVHDSYAFEQELLINYLIIPYISFLWMQTFTCNFGSKMKICFIDDFAKLSSHRKIPVEQFYN